MNAGKLPTPPFTAVTISDEHRRFLHDYIETVGQLEVLLLLYRSKDETLSLKKIGKTLGMNVEVVARQLSDLSSHGLIQKTSEAAADYFFHPADPHRSKMTFELARLYETHRTSVIECIYKPKLKSLKEFANAFRLRKDEP